MIIKIGAIFDKLWLHLRKKKKRIDLHEILIKTHNYGSLLYGTPWMTNLAPI
ncbi:MAG: hypothetical protein WCT05_14700 [Lentisphaeria bacterium]